jgi:hypothetical protein
MLRTEWHDKLETEALKVELLDSAQSDVNLLANRHPVTERRSPDATFAGQAAPVDGQNGGGARQSLAAAREDAPATPLKAGKDTSIYVGRAMLIEKIRREIVEISQKIELGEDYDIMIRDSSVFAGYITVVVCNRQPALCDKLCLIGTTKKPRIIDLACEIASHTSNGSDAKPLLPKTYHDAHKRYGSEARRRLAQRQ